MGLFCSDLEALNNEWVNKWLCSMLCGLCCIKQWWYCDTDMDGTQSVWRIYGLYVVLNYVCTRQCVIQLSCYMNKCCIIQVSSSNLRHTNIRHILNLTDNNDDNNSVGMEWIYNFNSDTITVWIRLLPSLPAHVGRCNNSQLFGRFVLMYRRVNEMSIKLIILMDFDWSRLACGKCGVCGWCFI